MFFLLCSSSFVESGSDLYTQNLVDHFAGDETLQTWLSQHWEHEEMQHGRALAHLRAARCGRNSTGTPASGRSGTNTARSARPSSWSTVAGLELAARCVVETGTASLYRALNEITDEPVLKQLTNHIKSDEVRHYKHFYQHYRLYREREGFGRYKVFRAILRRVNEIKSEDSDIALRHVFNQCYPQQIGNETAVPPDQRPRPGPAAPAHPGRDDGEDAAQAAGTAGRPAERTGKAAGKDHRKAFPALSRNEGARSTPRVARSRPGRRSRVLSPGCSSPPPWARPRSCAASAATP